MKCYSDVQNMMLALLINQSDASISCYAPIRFMMIINDFNAVCVLLYVSVLIKYMLDAPSTRVLTFEYFLNLVGSSTTLFVFYKQLHFK